jgi:hypothetical protein
MRNLIDKCRILRVEDANSVVEPMLKLSGQRHTYSIQVFGNNKTIDHTFDQTFAPQGRPY